MLVITRSTAKHYTAVDIFTTSCEQNAQNVYSLRKLLPQTVLLIADVCESFVSVHRRDDDFGCCSDLTDDTHKCQVRHSPHVALMQIPAAMASDCDKHPGC